MSEILRRYAWQCLDLAVRVVPYFALGVLLAGFLEVYAGGGVLRRRLLGRSGVTILVAALLGAVIPICSCGVVPVVTGLIAGGVPLAPGVDNLNVLMKTLNIIMIALMLPTFVVSIFSMNVPLPLPGYWLSFWIVLTLSAITALVVGLVWRYKRL